MKDKITEHIEDLRIIDISVYGDRDLTEEERKENQICIVKLTMQNQVNI